MKKIFTLVAAAVMALAANAAEFTDNLSINVFGETTSQEATVVVEEVAGSDGTYDITLKDFSFGTFNLGDIKMENVKGNSDSEGFVNFEKTETSITIAIGNADVTINEGSRMKGDKLYMDMDISAMGGGITVEAVFGDNEFPVSYTFTDNLSINVFGETTSQEATVVVEEVAGSDGTYDITLKDFSFGTFNLGDIKMENVKGNSDSEGFVNFEKTETSITIAIGNADVTINEGSRMKGDKLYMDMDISAMGGAITVEAVFGDNDFTSTGISRPTIVVDNGVEAIYDLNGRKLNEMQKGINIVRKADGTTVKVLKK